MKRKLIKLNQINTSYEYDGMSRLKRLKDEKLLVPIEDRQYSYNTASQINQIAETLNTKNFSYDNVDRLTGMTSPTLTNENYSFDSVGNRTTSHLSSTYTTQSFNRLTATSTETFSYDSNGNMLTKVDSSGTWNYEWDYENRLKKVTKPNNDYVEYEFDSLGRRTKRSLSTGTWTKFTYDGLDVVLDQNSSGTNVKYINGLGIDNKLGRITGTSTEYFLKDHLGSTTAITNSLGLVTEQNSYDSFGNPTNSTFSTRYQYTGREYDDFSGLYYYRNRWYSSELGRFISEDPIGLNGGDINLYGYVENNPIYFKDPSGLVKNPYYTACVAGYTTLGGAVGFVAGGGLGLITGPGAVAASPAGAVLGTAAGGLVGGGIGTLACGTPPYPSQVDSLPRTQPAPFPIIKDDSTCDVKPQPIPYKLDEPLPPPPPGGDRDGCAEEISACVQLCSEAEYDPSMKHIWGGSRTACLKGCISERCQKGFKFY